MIQKAIDRAQVAVNEELMFDQIERTAVLNVPDMGELMAVTKQVVRQVPGHEGVTVDDVEVMVMFPIPHPQEPGQVKPAAVKVTLNTFLNLARMLALQHGAYVRPAAFTDDNVPSKITKPN